MRNGLIILAIGVPVVLIVAPVLVVAGLVLTAGMAVEGLAFIFSDGA